jgi:hypothetical protein
LIRVSNGGKFLAWIMIVFPFAGWCVVLVWDESYHAEIRRQAFYLDTVVN